MSTYCISDIHGNFKAFLEMLDIIAFGDDDELYVLGDIIDKGPSSAEMLKWATDAPSNVHFLRGNHEDMAYVCLSRDPIELRCLLREDKWYRNDGNATWMIWMIKRMQNGARTY